MNREFHVALNGEDCNRGTADAPFATLTCARNAIRELKSQGPLMQPVNVIIHGGAYYLD
jgi:hypothetical protein